MKIKKQLLFLSFLGVMVQAEQGSSARDSAQVSAAEKQEKLTTINTKIAYCRRGWQPDWRGVPGGWKWFIFEEPAHLWTQKNSKGQEIAGAFSFGKHEVLLKKFVLSRMKDIVWHGYHNDTQVSADCIMSWQEFTQKYPAVAAAFAQEHKDAAEKPFAVSGGFGMHVTDPKDPSSNTEHRSDMVTVWKPSKQLLQAYRHNETLVKEEVPPFYRQETSFEGNNRTFFTKIKDEREARKHRKASDKLFHAVEWGKYEEAVEALKAGASVHALRWNAQRTPILDMTHLYGERYKSIEMIELLLDHGAYINAQDADGDTALYKAARENNHELVSFLLERGASPKIGNNPLYASPVKQDIALAKTLLKAGAPLETMGGCSGADKTPLHEAVYWQNTDLAAVLLEHGANPNARDKKGRSILNEVCTGFYYRDEHGDRDAANSMMQLLLEHGANPKSIGLAHNDLQWWYGQETAHKMLHARQKLATQ